MSTAITSGQHLTCLPTAGVLCGKSVPAGCAALSPGARCRRSGSRSRASWTVTSGATARLTGQVSAVARELAGRASARLLLALGITASRHTMLRVLLKIPLPALAVPRVLGIDDFALRRGSACATVLIDAETGQRVNTVKGRTADVAEKWLRDHPGTEVVCRDGSGATARRSAGRCPARFRSATADAPPGAAACPLTDRFSMQHRSRERVTGLWSLPVTTCPSVNSEPTRS